MTENMRKKFENALTELRKVCLDIDRSRGGVEQIPDEKLLNVADHLGIPVYFSFGTMPIAQGLADGLTEFDIKGPEKVRVTRIMINKRCRQPINFVFSHELGHALDGITTPAFYYLVAEAQRLYGLSPGSPGAKLTLLSEERAWKIGRQVMDRVGVQYDPDLYDAEVARGLEAHKAQAARLVR